MERREFLRGVAAGMLGGSALYLGACGATAPTPPDQGAAATTTSAPEGQEPERTEGAQAPAQRQELPTLEWTMVTSWPTSLDTIYGGAVTVAERVKAMTNGRFSIRTSPAGELVPGLQVLNAVQEGAFEMGHTASYYYTGISPVMGFGTSLPFGLTASQQNAWLYEGGGLAALQEFYAEKFNVIQFPAGNTGTQMGGWFNKEVNTANDLQGLKMRIPGLGGEVMTRLGVNVQLIPGPEIFQALDTGVVDAAEWVGPYDDQILGFQNAAEYYYYPGWWEPGPTLEVQINREKWDELPAEYQEIIKTAAYEANLTMIARYEARNQNALTELVDGGVKLRAYSDEILGVAEEAAMALYDEFSEKDADFRQIYEQWSEFRTGVYTWNKTNEAAFTTFVYSKLAASS